MKSDPHRFDDLFFEFGPITLRRFFGGEGIYSGETMITPSPLHVPPRAAHWQRVMGGPPATATFCREA